MKNIMGRPLSDEDFARQVHREARKFLFAAMLIGVGIGALLMALFSSMIRGLL